MTKLTPEELKRRAAKYLLPLADVADPVESDEPIVEQEQPQPSMNDILRAARRPRPKREGDE